MGHIGVNRNVIHPRFGNYILLNTVLIDAEVDRYGTALAYNRCLGCNLCVAACPVGAIHANGEFDQVRYLDFKPDVSAVANFSVGLRHMFRPTPELEVGCTVAFRFPDGQLTATLDDGKLATVEHFDADAEAIVICDEPDYIRILYRPVAGRPDPLPLRYAVKGTREALELLLSQLG
jgi:ferredoxin